ncbi:YdhK family protein [Paenibacillus sp. JSM ZJ436]|uniref:YdhK family protein n=1 Tax=Paenibacillus sp. JSM ZJ436 TaxID=3376190 RepID=UPI00378FA04A
MKWLKICFFISVLMVALAGCGEEASHPAGSTQHEDHASHSTTGKVPEGLKEAANPMFQAGSQVMIRDEHMPGMKGAQATVAGAYETVVYTVSYTPVAGGDEVTNHKWVIHEEIQDAGSDPLKAGTTVVLTADHMPGMKGAKATVDSAQSTTVYMIDFIPTTGGAMVKNHQWVTENELSPL